MKVKRLLVTVLTLSAVMLALTACGKKDSDAASKNAEKDLNKSIAEAAEKLAPLGDSQPEGQSVVEGQQVAGVDLPDDTSGRVGTAELDDGKDYPLYYYDGLCYIIKDNEAFVTDTALSDNYLEEYIVRDFIEEDGKKYPVTMLEDNCFDGYSEAKKIIIPESITVIGDECFYGCDSLESIVIPESVKELGNSLFAECTSLKNVRLPKNVEKFGEGMFFNCEKLESCELPYNLTEIPTETFSGCTEVKDIVIPVTVTKIGIDAFWSCESVEKLSLPQGITEIGDGAFFDCCAIKELYLPPALESFEPDFEYCDELTFVCISKKFYDTLVEYFEGTSVEICNMDDPNCKCYSNCASGECS